MTRGWRVATALSTGTVLAIASIMASPAAGAEPQTPLGCAPVQMITARGSGEDLSGGHGGQLTSIVDAVARTTLKDGFEGTTIEASAIPYPAVGMSQYVAEADTTDLLESIEYGRLIGLRMVQATRDRCPDTRFIFVGYSQGVIVVRQIAEDLPTTAVAGVVGVGDAAQKGDEPGVVGSGRGGDGIYRWITTRDDGTASSDSFYAAGIPYAMWCHARDWICNFYDGEGRPPDTSNPFFQTYDHHYGEDPIEMTAIAGTIVKMARDATQTSPGSGQPGDDEGGEDGSVPTVPGGGTAQAVDLMFCIDTTGSMEPYIDEARASARRIAETLRANATAVRVGVVEYRDGGDAFRARTVLPLSEDVAAFQRALDGLVADGGGDTPESVFSGVMVALNQDWDAEAIRSLVILGDARPKDPEPGTGFTSESVMDAMRSLSNVPTLPPTLGGGASPIAFTERIDTTDDAADVSLFALTPSSGLAGALQPVADGTGGRITAVSGSDEVSTELVNTMVLIATVPAASIGEPPLAVAGLPFTVSAATSSALPGSTYAFDADGDGLIDSMSTAQAQQVTVEEPGDYTATVAITDPFGRKVTASTSYVVIDESDLQELPHADDDDRSGSSALPLGLSKKDIVTAGLAAGAAMALIMLGFVLGRRRRSHQAGAST
jgi:hypothetical protein